MAERDSAPRVGDRPGEGEDRGQREGHSGDRQCAPAMRDRGQERHRHGEPDQDDERELHEKRGGKRGRRPECGLPDGRSRFGPREGAAERGHRERRGEELGRMVIGDAECGVGKARWNQRRHRRGERGQPRVEQATRRAP